MDENLKEAQENLDEMEKRVEKKKIDIETYLLVIVLDLVFAYGILANIRIIQIIGGIVIILRVIVDAFRLKKDIDNYKWMASLYDECNTIHKFVKSTLNNRPSQDTKDETH